MAVTEKVTEPEWYTTEIWGADGAPLVITNPIYVMPSTD